MGAIRSPEIQQHYLAAQIRQGEALTVPPPHGDRALCGPRKRHRHTARRREHGFGRQPFRFLLLYLVVSPGNFLGCRSWFSGRTPQTAAPTRFLPPTDSTPAAPDRPGATVVARLFPGAAQVYWPYRSSFPPPFPKGVPRQWSGGVLLRWPARRSNTTLLPLSATSLQTTNTSPVGPTATTGLVW